MYLRVIGAALSLACVSATPYVPGTTATDIDPSAYPAIVRVDCLVGRGTAFRVGPHLLLSVNHVTKLGGCMVNGKPLNVLRHDGDFSINDNGETAEAWMRVDCGGYVAGRKYRALGYARGLNTLTEVDLVATGRSMAGFDALFGVFTVIPGQSGGPVIDAETGKVVGTVNTYNAAAGLSGSVALKDTSLCRS